MFLCDAVAVECRQLTPTSPSPQVHTALASWKVSAAVWVYDESLNAVIVMCAQSPTLKSVLVATPGKHPGALYTHGEFVEQLLPPSLRTKAPRVFVTCFAGEDGVTHTVQQVRNSVPRRMRMQHHAAAVLASTARCLPEQARAERVPDVARRGDGATVNEQLGAEQP